MNSLDRRINRLTILEDLILLLLAACLLFLVGRASAADYLAFTWPEDASSIELPTLPLLDTDKLCRAIAVAETGGCTTGMALTRNNCHGIMAWRNGTRVGQAFRSTGESQAACVELWGRKYKTFPDMRLAVAYTGRDNAAQWLGVVTDYYRSH